MKTICIGPKRYVIDEAVVREFMRLRSRQAKLWRKIRIARDLVEKSNLQVLDKHLSEELNRVLSSKA